VRYVGGNRFAWVKEETLAAELHRSASTIKRWMQQLVQAGLIRRGRRFGATSLTFLTTYDPVDAAAVQDDAQDAMQAAAPVAGHAPTEPAMAQDDPGDGAGEDVCAVVGDASAGTETTTPTPVEGPAAVPAARPTSFFEPRCEPSISSHVRRDSIKTTQLNSHGGGGTGSPTPSGEVVVETATTARLQEEGIVDITVLNELHDRPIAQVETVIRYVAHCRTRDDPRRPGLIVHLLRRGFGLRRRSRHPAASCAPPQGMAPATAALPVAPALPALPADGIPRDPLVPTDAVVPADELLTPVWQQTLALLQVQLDPAGFETWIAPNRLLVLEGETAVLGTPNVFVRDELAAHYRTLVEATVGQVLGRPITLEVVIGTALELP
jgi:hypothetical protein